jgi:hypothetical protein
VQKFIQLGVVQSKFHENIFIGSKDIVKPGSFKIQGQKRHFELLKTSIIQNFKKGKNLLKN